jgi:hypothetical protein
MSKPFGWKYPFIKAAASDNFRAYSIVGQE